jgi:hypothetical protein
VATLNSLADRLRFEIGDTGKSFVHQIIADGTTDRFLIPYSPVNGATLMVYVDNVDVSNDATVEELTGYVTLDVMPGMGDVIVFSGTYYRYFIDTEICQFVDTAFGHHVANHGDAYGRGYTLASLPGIEEYPVVIYASSLALYTLATDASFDIDITAPDGVQIPRSERYRQLMQMIEVRKNQYKELCSQLGIGLYKIDVFSLRRISKTTNHYVPIYLPQEVDNRSPQQRALIPIPSYGSAISPSDVPTYDLMMYQGDSFSVELDFPFDISAYTFTSELRIQAGSVTKVGTFTITPVVGDNSKLTLSLTPEETESLPERCYWDIQATDDADPTYQKTYMRGAVVVTRQVTK